MRTKVLAAVDNSGVASMVLSVADAVAATLFRGEVVAIHVAENGKGTALRAAERAGLELDIQDGPIVPSIVQAAGAPEVAAVVVGSRSSPEGPRPAGHIALQIMTSIAKPLFAVPPETSLPYVLKRALVPLDSSPLTAAAAHQALLLGCESGLDIVILHVHSLEALPMFDDHLHHETRVWIDEFIARNCPESIDVGVEQRVGLTHERILDVTDEAGADLIVLAWARDLSAGRAVTVRETVRDSAVPVLLLPRPTDL